MSFGFDMKTPDAANLLMSHLPSVKEAGLHCSSLSPEQVVIQMPSQPGWIGDAVKQTLHPGVSSLLADTACAISVSAAHGSLLHMATLDLRMDYLRPAPVGIDLYCEARCVRMSKHVAFTQAWVFQHGKPDPVVAVTANMMLGQSTPGQKESSAAFATSMPELPPVNTWPGEPALPAGASPYSEYLGLQWHSPTLPIQAHSPAVYRMPFQPKLIGNPMLPALHGGLIAAYAQSAGVLHLIKSNQTAPDRPPRAVDFSIDYLRPAKPVDTWARCTTIRQGSRIALVHMVLWQDDEHRPIATARTQCLIPPLTP